MARRDGQIDEVVLTRILHEREVLTTPYDPSLETLAQQIDDQELIVKPGFQRGDIWTRTKKSRLIESLLLNIPIPPVFFAEDVDRSRVVVDGQQRLRSVHQFLRGQLRLRDLEVLKGLNGIAWDDLPSRVQRLIKNRSIRAIVISYRADEEVRYEVFQRLNTGGVTLTSQELRNSLYRGDLNDLLHDLANSDHVLAALRRKRPHKRLRDNELILRYLVLRHHLADYRPPLNRLLDDFMRDRRVLMPHEKEELRSSFLSTVEVARAAFGPDAFRIPGVGSGAVNRTVFELQMLSVEGMPLEAVEQRATEIRDHFRQLFASNSAFKDALTKSTADRSKFYRRLRLWGAELSDLGLPPGYMPLLPETAPGDAPDAAD